MTTTHLIALSVMLLVAATLLCWHQGLFDGGGGHDLGMGLMFKIAIYVIVWALPSLIGLVVYLIWGVPR